MESQEDTFDETEDAGDDKLPVELEDRDSDAGFPEDEVDQPDGMVSS